MTRWSREVIKLEKSNYIKKKSSAQLIFSQKRSDLGCATAAVREVAVGEDGTLMPRDCGSAPLDNSLLLLETLPRGHVLGQAHLGRESLAGGFCFGVKASSFIRSVSCHSIHQGLGIRKSCEDGGTGEKSSEKLRPITLMSGARAAHPEGLCKPPSFGFHSVSYTVFDTHSLKSCR